MMRQKSLQGIFYDEVFEKGQDILNRIIYAKTGSLKQDAACSALYAYAKESPEVTTLLAIAVAKTMSDLREYEKKRIAGSQIA